MKKVVSVKKTSIIAGEGKSENIFLEYIKSLYWKKGQHDILVHKNIQQGNGGGSSVSVAQEVMKRCGIFPRDAIVLLLDKDIAGEMSCTDITRKALQICKCRSVIPKDKIKCIMMTPCFEGFILRILGKKPLDNSSYCKQGFEKIFGKKAPKVNAGLYATYCPKELLENRRKCIPELNELIKYFEVTTKDGFIEYFGK